jgi:hypothetical protein
VHTLDLSPIWQHLRSGARCSEFEGPSRRGRELVCRLDHVDRRRNDFAFALSIDSQAPFRDAADNKTDRIRVFPGRVASQLFHTRRSGPDMPRTARAHRVVPETPVRSLFDFGGERVETLAPGVFVFGQSGLEQTPQAKLAAHAKRAATVRALVRLATGKRISKAVEIHLRQVKSAVASRSTICDGASGSGP